MSFRVGQKVVCVSDFAPHLRAIEISVVVPVVNEIYTVRDIETTNYATTIRLEEIVNPKLHYREGLYEVSFDIDGFRPIDYSFGEKVAEQITEQVEKTFKEETIEV